MNFKGYNFTRARTVVTFPLKPGENNLRFGRICKPDQKGAEPSSLVYAETQETVYAKPIALKGHSLTNMAFGTDGKVYLSKDGACWTAYLKSAVERGAEKVERRLRREAKAREARLGEQS